MVAVVIDAGIMTPFTFPKFVSLFSSSPLSFPFKRPTAVVEIAMTSRWKERDGSVTNITTSFRDTTVSVALILSFIYFIFSLIVFVVVERVWGLSGSRRLSFTFCFCFHTKHPRVFCTFFLRLSFDFFFLLPSSPRWIPTQFMSSQFLFFSRWRPVF